MIAVAYALLIGWTYVALRPARLSALQHALGGVLVIVLCVLVAAPLAIASRYASTTANLVNTVFGTESGTTRDERPVTIVADPWRDQPRVNVLILGGDSGEDRAESLGDRTDTVIVASIDTHTGATTLFTLPRNTGRMPFPTDSPLSQYYPYGFYDGMDAANPEFLLNAMYRNVPARLPHDALGETKDVGAEVLKASVGEALGLEVDYFVKVNMDGFKDFVDAIGGITLNVNYPIPIGGKTDAGIAPDEWIEVGADQEMNGRRALWYARGRYGLDDYKRMERQRCVINAAVEQATPLTVLRNYQSIAAAGEKSITTDIPRSMLPAMLSLAEEVRDTKLRSVVFTPGAAGFNSFNPDWPAVRARVRTALKETAKGAATSTPTRAPSASTPSAVTAPEGKSDNLDDVCGYHPQG